MHKKKFKNVVVLLSGGLDSSCLAYFAGKNTKPYIKNRVYSLTFDYGQRHKKELLSAFKISKAINAVDHKVVKFDLTLWGGSALTDMSMKVPFNRAIFNGKPLNFQSRKLTKVSIPNTYVPARNTIFLSFALAYAEAVSASEIYIGVNSIDYSGYVDCRPLFIKRFQELAKVATVSGVNGKTIKIKTPLIKLTKSDIVRLGTRLGVDWSKTWSCYKGKKKACGLCDSCQLRLKGFALAGIKDPLCYKQYPKFYEKFMLLAT